MVAAFHGLPFSSVQYQHGFFAHGYGRAFALGQGRDDGAVADFADDVGAAGGAGGQRSVEPFKTRRVIPRMIVPCMRFSGRVLRPFGFPLYFDGFNKRLGGFLSQAVRNAASRMSGATFARLTRVGPLRPPPPGTGEKMSGSSSTIPACCSGVSTRTP